MLGVVSNFQEDRDKPRIWRRRRFKRLSQKWGESSGPWKRLRSLSRETLSGSEKTRQPEERIFWWSNTPKSSLTWQQLCEGLPLELQEMREHARVEQGDWVILLSGSGSTPCIQKLRQSHLMCCQLVFTFLNACRCGD